MDWFAFQETDAMQIQCLANLSPRVSDAAAVWFTDFANIETAVAALEARPWQVANCNPGSPWFNDVIDRLKRNRSLP